MGVDQIAHHQRLSLGDVCHRLIGADPGVRKLPEFDLLSVSKLEIHRLIKNLIDMPKLRIGLLRKHPGPDEVSLFIGLHPGEASHRSPGSDHPGTLLLKNGDATKLVRIGMGDDRIGDGMRGPGMNELDGLPGAFWSELRIKSDHFGTVIVKYGMGIKARGWRLIDVNPADRLAHLGRAGPGGAGIARRRPGGTGTAAAPEGGTQSDQAQKGGRDLGDLAWIQDFQVRFHWICLPGLGLFSFCFWTASEFNGLRNAVLPAFGHGSFDFWPNRPGLGRVKLEEMKQGQDLAARFPGLHIIHQKIRGKEVAAHVHPKEHELFLPFHGEIQIGLGATGELKASPGKLIYLPPEVPHSFRSSVSGEGERLICIIEEGLWKKAQGVKSGPASLPASQLLKEILFYLLVNPRTRAAHSLSLTLVETLGEMLEEPWLDPRGDTMAGLLREGTISGTPFAHLARGSTDSRLKSALRKIENEFDQELSMQELARESGLSVRSLNRLFLSELRLTPKQLVTLYRVERARKLLAHPKATVTDVALAVGYQSLSQFISVFRRVTGQLPSEI